MLAFGLHFAYMPMHNVMSIILLGLAWLGQTHVSHVSGWCTHAYSVHNHFSLYQIENIL